MIITEQATGPVAVRICFSRQLISWIVVSVWTTRSATVSKRRAITFELRRSANLWLRVTGNLVTAFLRHLLLVCGCCSVAMDFNVAASEIPLIFEAEEFQVVPGAWQRQAYGENYYVGTFANTFLSRKAFLSAPERCRRSLATFRAVIPKAGEYLALVRYEAAYRFETRFRLRIEQGGLVRMDRGYGARENVKIWPFGKRLTNEVAWDWGASENIVWEGHDAKVELEAGPAILSLVAENQPEPAARRNIDLVMLTSDLTNVEQRIQKEGYLPLDGILTQADDLFLRIHNLDSVPITVRVPPGTEHSPYWVHQRGWAAKNISTEANRSSDWLEVGSLLDSLNDGQWQLSPQPPGAHYHLEFAIRSGDQLQTIRQFKDLTNGISLAYDANTRYSRRIRSTDEVLSELVAYLKKQPIQGRAPRKTLVYGTTFPARPGDAEYTANLNEFLRLMGASALSTGSRDDAPLNGLLRGYIDVRGQNPKQLEATCLKLAAEGRAEKIAIISLGDEISLASPPKNANEGFRSWLQSQGLEPGDVAPGVTAWEQVQFSGREDRNDPHSFYYSQLYRHHYGIAAQKELTEVLHRLLPQALIGANYSPHHAHFYLGETHKWVSLFREGGMTMPWSEDYIFQVPVASPQVNFLSLDLFRAGTRGKAEAKIHFYVMPHWPGTTPNQWRRQFYGDLAHGAKIINLFEFRPVQVAYTENHCSSPEMYQTIREALHELGTFEDIVQSGSVRPGVAALWFSETSDLWNDNRTPFDAAKRSLYLAIRHQQLSLDVLVPGDELKPYKILYLTDQHVSKRDSKAMVEWVENGGRLFATAGAGMFDEFDQPNRNLRDLLGVQPQDWIRSKEMIRFEKQDLPFALPIERVRWRTAKFPIFGAATRIQTTARIEGRFNDGSPAITTREVGRGRVTYCSFLPAFTWLKPALPIHPVDRSSRDNALCHFIPTRFDRAIDELMGSQMDIERPIICSEPTVETTIIESRDGMVIPLVNWSPNSIKNLNVTLSVSTPPGNPVLASGNPVRVSRQNQKLVLTVSLSAADALIFLSGPEEK